MAASIVTDKPAGQRTGAGLRLRRSLRCVVRLPCPALWRPH